VESFDLIVIGSGPAGRRARRKLSIREARRIDRTPRGAGRHGHQYGHGAEQDAAESALYFPGCGSADFTALIILA